MAKAQDKDQAESPEITRMKTEMSKMQDAIDDKDRGIRDLNSTITSLKDDLAAKDETTQTLTSENESLNIKLESAQGLNANYERDMTIMRHNLAEAKEHAKAEVALRTGVIMGVQAVGGMLTPLDGIAATPKETREGKL